MGFEPCSGKEGYQGELLWLKGTLDAQRLASGLLAMARAPGLTPLMRPYHRRSKVCALFAKLAQQVAKGLEVYEYAPWGAYKRRAAKYAAELAAIKGQVWKASWSSREQKESLSFVLPGYTHRCLGAPPSRRSARLGAALRGHRSRAAVLWRFR